MRWPTISIVISSGDFDSLQLTILSVLRQEYPAAVEILLDGSVSELRIELRDKFPMIRSGPRSAARHDIVALPRAGDFYLPDAFTNSISALVQNPELDIACGCEIRLQGDGESYHCSSLSDETITPRSLLMQREITASCAFFWRRVIEDSNEWHAPGWKADVECWYRALHRLEAKFLPHHIAVLQGNAGPVRDAAWRDHLQELVESCELDPHYAAKFRFSATEKRELYCRWSLLEARHAGNEARVSQLLDQLYRGSDEHTRVFLVRHGFLPKFTTSGVGIPPVAVDWLKPDFGALPIRSRVA